MAYRRRHGISRTATFKEEIYHSPRVPVANDDNEFDGFSPPTSSSSASLAARAIRASAAHRDSSAYGYAYGAAAEARGEDSVLLHRDSDLSGSRSTVTKGPVLFESASLKNPDDDDSRYGFWGILARKAKAILEDETDSPNSQGPNRMRPDMNDASTGEQLHQEDLSPEGGRRVDNVRIRKGLDALTSSLNNIGGSIGKHWEEGRAAVENKTSDIIQETRKFQSRRRGGSEAQNQESSTQTSWKQPGTQPSQAPSQSNQETQLKASRDVAMATAAKAKLLLRELKTTKADLAFAKERCAQLEEENKRLREGREKGGNPADDDLIRLQLETLLAEKARLAHENSIYARENRFLREIVEYHQLTMQDIVSFDEGSEESAEVSPFSVYDTQAFSSSPTSPTSPNTPSSYPPQTKEHASEISPSDGSAEERGNQTGSSDRPLPISKDTDRPSTEAS